MAVETKRSGGLTHYIGGCYDCDATWGSRNVVGVAARHAKAKNHRTWAELGHSYSFTPTEQKVQP